MKLLLPTLAALASLSLPLTAAQDDAQKTANDISAAYAAAFQKGDAAAVAALYTEDARFTSEDGNGLNGRAAIQDSSANVLKKPARPKLQITSEAAREVAPGVILDKGISSTTTASGETSSVRYAATIVRSGDKWLIADLQEFPAPAADPAAAALASLDWLIGEWKVNKDGVNASGKAEWTLDGNFITRTFTIQREGMPFVTVEVIGYDRENDRIRSWMFDNEGGFGEGTWRQEDNKWIVLTKATMPGGGEYTGEAIFTVLPGGKTTWEMQNRVKDGEAMPNLDRVELVKTPAPKTK